MDLHKASALLADQTIERFKVGESMGNGYVYLSFCLKSLYWDIKWKTKKVWGKPVFVKRGKGDVYLHVVVSEEEYSEWITYETTGVYPEGTEDVQEEDENEDEGPLEVTLPTLKDGKEEVVCSSAESEMRQQTKPIPRKKKDTLEWQRRRLIRVLLGGLRKKQIADSKKGKKESHALQREAEKKIREEKRKVRQALQTKAREEKAKAHEAKVNQRWERRLKEYELKKAERRERIAEKSPKFFTTPTPDPKIDTYDYPITIKVCGAMWVETMDLQCRATIKTGDYSARKVSVPSLGETWLVLRYPQNTGQTEYGHNIKRWIELLRSEGDKVSVSIVGLD